MAEPDPGLSCPICHNPIEPGAPVLFSAVFGTPRAVHLKCGTRAYRKRNAGEPPGPKRAKDEPGGDDKRKADDPPKEASG